jgi:hypothetical protein
MIISTAAAVFAATTFVAVSASAQVACKGANACKGQGFINRGSTLECKAILAK